MSVCLSVCLSICLSFWLSSCISICFNMIIIENFLSLYLSIGISVHSTVCDYLSAHVCLTVCLSVWLTAIGQGNILQNEVKRNKPQPVGLHNDREGVYLLHVGGCGSLEGHVNSTWSPSHVSYFLRLLGQAILSFNFLLCQSVSRKVHFCVCSSRTYTVNTDSCISDGCLQFKSSNKERNIWGLNSTNG